MSVIPVEENAETVVPNAETEKPPVSLHDRLVAIADKYDSKADAAETATEETPAAEGAPAVATQAGSGEAAVETPVAAPEKVEVTADQLADTAYWGSLDKDGWARMERDYPAETKLLKSAQAAASKIVNAARKEAPKPEERSPATTDDEPSEDEIDQQLISLDPADVRNAVKKLVAATLKQNGVDPDMLRANATVAAAFEAAVAEMPQLATFTSAELDAAVDSSRTLKALVEFGTPKALTEAMLGAGQILTDRKKAAADAAAAIKVEADRKKKETQTVVRSNANVASKDALKPHGGGVDTRTLRERLNARADAEIARQGGP